MNSVFNMAMTYTFVILDPADPAGPFLHEETDVTSGASITQFEVPSTLVLDEDTEYTWYAYATDTLLVDGPESEHVTFLVSETNSAPPASDPLTPNDGAIFVLGATPLLEGVAVADPDGDEVEYWFEIADDSFRNSHRIEDWCSGLIRVDAQQVDRCGDLLLRLLAETRKVAQLLLGNGGSKTIDLDDADVFLECKYGFGSQPGDLEKIKHRGRKSVLQPSDLADRSVLDILEDLASSAVTDPFDRLQLVEGEVRNIHRRSVDRVDRLLIGTSAKRLGLTVLQLGVRDKLAQCSDDRFI